VRHDRLQDCCSPTLETQHGVVYDLNWPWEARKKRQTPHRYCGKTSLSTDRQDLSEHRLVVAYRSQAMVEERSCISTRRRPGLWWPAYPWTDSQLAVQALSGFVTLWLMRIVLLQLHARSTYRFVFLVPLE